MRLAHTRQPRWGFTLIELLVVIAIISILVGLTAAAVIQYLNKIPIVNTTNDIRQLSLALENFKNLYGEYPPSRLKLSENCNYPQRGIVGSLDYDSLRFLNKLFPRVNFAAGTQIDWDGDGKFTTQVDWILEGDECLVFCLGGTPAAAGQPNGVVGINIPVAINGKKIDPLFSFSNDRLQPTGRLQNNNKNFPRRFYVFLDQYGTKMPYLYFSSGNRANGYNAYGANNRPVSATAPINAPSSDCSSGGFCPSLNNLTAASAVWPWAQTATAGPLWFNNATYVNPNTYQILSAGRNAVFGAGTSNTGITWTQATAGNLTLTNPAGADDQSNFSDRLLGIP